MALIELEQVTRRYVMGESIVSALDGVSLTIEEGEFLAVTGRSGSGKTTLLNLLGGLDRPTGGAVRSSGMLLGELSDDALADYRLQKVGFVFQFFNLLPGRTALQNVEMPLLLGRWSAGDRRAQAMKLLEMVELGLRAHHKPDELSGGEQQRVAIARSLAHDPPLLLADEPTGNLDTKTASSVLDLLTWLNEEQKKTILMVTHDSMLVGQRAKRNIVMQDGKVAQDERS